MDIVQIIEASSLDTDVKSSLIALVREINSALSENLSATNEMRVAKTGMNERQYAQRLVECKPGEKRDVMLMTQLAWRNCFANSVYRVQGAQRAIQQYGLALHTQISALDKSDISVQSAVVAIKTLIDHCVFAGADKPNAVVRELDEVADISRAKIEDAVRELFQQKSTGIGKYANTNFSSQPIMVTSQDSAEQRALWDASQLAIVQFYELRAASDAYRGAKSKLNVPQYVDRLEKAQTAGDNSKFEQIRCEQKTLEAALFVAASHFLSLVGKYQAKIDAFAAVIDTAAKALTDNKGNRNLVSASNCIGAWHWLHEMRLQHKCAQTSYDAEAVLEQLNFDVDAYLALKVQSVSKTRPCTQLC